MVYNTALQSKFHSKVPEAQPSFAPPPIHPALVHFPIAFSVLAFGLDILYLLTTTYIKPAYLTTRYASPQTLADIAKLSYFLLCAGLITTVPALLSGMAQLQGMIAKNGGPWAKDADGEVQNYMVPRIKRAITHAAVNDVVFVANLYSWWVRRDEKNVGHVPSLVNMGISCVLLPCLLGAAKMGGELVYNHGVGLQLGNRKKVE